MLGSLVAWLDRMLFAQPFEGRLAHSYASAARPAFGDLDDRLHDAWAGRLATASTLLDVGCGPATFSRYAPELGTFLRRKRVHEAQLAEWQRQVTDGAVAALRGPSGRDRKAANVEAKRVRELERELERKEQGAGGGGGALDPEKKSPGHLGGRGRRHDAGERRVIREVIEEAVMAGVGREQACELLGLPARTLGTLSTM